MHQITKKIYYHDTDCGGVVYYANYLKYLEEARTEFFSDKGIGIKELGQKQILFVVRKVEIEYKAPASYADTLAVLTEITRFKNASLEFSQQIERAGRLLVVAKTQLVCVDDKFNPRIIPDPVIEKLRNVS